VSSGKNIVESKLDGLFSEAIYQPMWDRVEIADEPEWVFYHAISWLGQQENPERRIQRSGADLMWGIDRVVAEYDRAISLLECP
jgi:hypothetical protein